MDATDAKVAVLTGDPERVDWFAHLWGGTQLSSGARRGFRYVELADVVLMSTGIGGPALAIAVEELADLGVERFVRIGTCGGLGPRVRPGDLVLPVAAVGDDGTSARYLPDGVPAIPDHQLLTALTVEAARHDVHCHVGLVHSKDAYYTEEPERMTEPGATSARWDALRAVGVLATEMEAAALFAIGLVRRLRTAAVLVNVGADRERLYLRPGLELAVQVAHRAVLTTTGDPPGAL